VADQDEGELRKAARLAILEAIQDRAEDANPQSLHELAQAYALVASAAAPPNAALGSFA
jgi:hypothetical protein